MERGGRENSGERKKFWCSRERERNLKKSREREREAVLPFFSDIVLVKLLISQV